MVDDHSRLAYSEILPDEKGATCAAFILRAAEHFASHGITTIERVITDNHFSYRHSTDVKNAMTALGATHKFIKPHCPWQNGKVERLNRTLQTEWAYRQVFTSNADRAAALAPGSSTATLNDATAHSEANHPSAACYQPDGSVHPAPVWLSGASRSGAAAALLRGALGEGPERH
jgi:transposase InsO family protein